MKFVTDLFGLITKKDDLANTMARFREILKTTKSARSLLCNYNYGSIDPFDALHPRAIHYVYMFVCVHVYMYVCVYVCMYEYVAYVCVDVCMWA